MKEKNFKTPSIILIAGGTASGKTSIAKSIESNFKKIRIKTISLDNYYYSKEELGKNMKISIWDNPKSINWNLVRSDFNKLKNNQTININEFDFKTNSHFKNKFIKIDPKDYDFIIYEGIFVFEKSYLLKSAILKIFVDVDSEERLIRRIRRDIMKKGETIITEKMDSFLTNWKNDITPSYVKFILPLKDKADIVIDYSSIKDKKIKTIKKIYNLIKEIYKNGK